MYFLFLLEEEEDADVDVDVDVDALLDAPKGADEGNEVPEIDLNDSSSIDESNRSVESLSALENSCLENGVLSPPKLAVR